MAAFLKPAVAVAFVVGAAAGAGTTIALRVPPTPTTSSPHTGERAAAPSPGGARTSLPRPTSANPADMPSTVRQVSRTNRLAAAPKRISAAKADAGIEVSGSLAAERALIDRARAALARARPNDALAALGQHRQRFAVGQLAEEREALTVMAQAAIGEHDRARETASRFRRDYPQSLLLPAVDAALRRTQPGQAGDHEKPEGLP